VDATPEEEAALDRSLAEIGDRKAAAVYPVLKAHDWPAREIAAHTFFLGKDRPPIPLVGYAYDGGENYVFVTKEELGERPVEALHEEAMANLRRVTLAWEAIDAHTLTASGHDFSAEKMLCGEFVVAAQEALGAEGVLIATPRRRVIYACNAGAPQEIKDRFVYVVARTLADDSFGNALITPLIFEYRGADVVGAMMVSSGED
jgi:uncharacterized protein YtpQ (UPF0354 family)